ncbi:hypothetical protein F5B17DRAFT_102311 [Nemania serpens]|nr:hypothetical protein F5B17DRAFT_102311 [Nemania serpens]
MAQARTIVYPTVPGDEEDPFGRINTMIKIFNESLPTDRHGGSIDTGLLFEIGAAKKLVRAGKISHGREISRGLTQEEVRLGLNGTSQMIKELMPNNTYRELDIVYGGKHIVEAKNRKTTSSSQMQKNLRLAIALGGTVSYALPSQPFAPQAYKEKSYREAYETALIDEGLRHDPNANPPEFGIVPVDVDSFADDYKRGIAVALAKVPTLEELLAEWDG